MNEAGEARMSKKKWLTDRTRTLLTLELAITLPAAALMAFSIWNLKHIQRSEAIEAAFQRDFSHVLGIAEKKTLHKAIDMITPAREEFPSPDADRATIKAKLEHILSEHPEFAYAFLYDKKNNLIVSRAQPGRDKDPEFCAPAQDAINMVTTWFPRNAPEMSTRVRIRAEKDEPPVVITGGWFHQGNQYNYWNLAYFLPPNVDKDRVVLGAVAFEDEYLKQTFFPAIMKDVLSSNSDVFKGEYPPLIIIRPSKEYTPWVTSGNWGEGRAEAERPFQYVFPDLTAAIKYQGTTVSDMVSRLLRYNYLVLTALSLLMIGGIWLTYRNVSRE